ncbi:MAG: EamA family transporter [Bacillota bacterium]|jgi:drug/metabolite transporter (DMT)-like permease
MWIIFTLISALLFATSSMVNKVAMREDTATEQLLPGTFLAGFVLLLVYTGRRLPDPSLPLVGAGFLMSVFSMTNCVTILLALRHGPMGPVAAVAGSHSILTPLLALLLFREGLTVWQWVAVGLATAAMALVQLKKSAAATAPSLVWFSLALLGALSSSGETIVLDRAVTLQNDGNAGLVWSYFFSFILTSLWFLRKRQRRFRRPFWLGAIDGAVSAVSMVFFAKALEGGPAGLVAALSTSAVILRALGGRVFFGEELPRLSWLGVILAVAAFGLASLF